eukprot:m51a1_g3573 hypothetical protein (540) ;mRNA; f:1102510-1105378
MCSKTVSALVLALAACVLGDCDLPYGWSNVIVTSHLKPRRALVYRPHTQSEFAQPPLWIHLHGITMAPEDHHFLYKFHQVAEQQGAGFIMAFPEGMMRSWDTMGNEDVDFMKVLAKNLQDRGCGNPQRTYLSGFSLGSSLAFTVGCRAPEVFAAIGRWGFNLPMCTPKLPMWYWSGTLDPIGNPGGYSAEMCYQWWAQHNGCNAAGASQETMRLGLAMVTCKKASCQNPAYETNVCMSQLTSHAADCDLPYGWSNVFVTNRLKPRRALVYRPRMQSEFGTPSLWVHLHGITMAPEDHLFFYKFHKVAEQQGAGFIMAFPEGMMRYWDTVGNEDVDFMKVLAKYMQNRGCADPQRTYLSGFSLGSSLTWTVGCRAPGVFAALAPTALPRWGTNLPMCRPKVPAWYWAGSLDPIGNPGYVSAEMCFQWWAQHNGCDGLRAEQETMTLNFAMVKCKKAICPDKAYETNFCMSQFTSHAWVWGSESHIWEFFKRHTLNMVGMVDNATDITDGTTIPEGSRSGAPATAAAGALGLAASLLATVF